MEFNEALKIVQNLVTVAQDEEYDGIIVKRLEASNTLDGGRNTNQTHIAISGDQMNMFPYLMADGYFQCAYDEKDEQLKKFFMLQIPLRIYKDNIDYLNNDINEDIPFIQNTYKSIRATLIRSRRKDQSDQVQLSLTTVDDREFVLFRKMLHTGDYLVILKLKGKLEYDCIGIKELDASKEEHSLSELNNKFYKLSTNTKVDLQKCLVVEERGINEKDFSLEELGNALKDMYENAPSKMQVTSIYIFGLKYGERIVAKAFGANEIIRAAGLNESYCTELNKALNIYKCLESNTYGLTFEQPYAQTKKVSRDIVVNNDRNRKKGGKNILFYGVPGAGKSHAINQIIGNEYSERVVFHPDYTYSDFVGQILPSAFEKKLEYNFEPGPFTNIMKKAYENPNNRYYLVIEELNRGNAPAIFGDVFQLLDRNEDGSGKYSIQNYEIADNIFGDKNELVTIPSNLSILATMNTSDQNIFTLDTAFQRRWEMHMIKNDVKHAQHSGAYIEGSSISWGVFASVTNSEIIHFGEDAGSSEDKRLGAYFAKASELSKKKFPEKVLKYLWDDAFKMDHAAYFNEDISCLDNIVDIFEEDGFDGDVLKRVLKYSVYSKMMGNKESTIKVESSVEGDEEDEKNNSF